ncbi:lipocalin-like domain-containing protein [soil metagenome]
MNRVSGTLACLALGLLGAGCSGPLLANAVPSVRPMTTSAPPTPGRMPDPQAVSLPADDAPHDRLKEWGYYTGHLDSADGERFGFELVTFRAERGRFPVAWAAHFAVTDETGGRFLYDQRAEVGAQVDRSSPGVGFDLSIAGDVVPGVRATVPAWRMAGSEGSHQLEAPSGRAASGAAFGLSLRLDDGSRKVLLHDGDGWVDFGPAGGSYYYSRPRMAAQGSLTLDGEVIPVTGSAWFDHQWGDFISVGGGWDWFAVNLDDGTDVTISMVRDPLGGVGLVYGTLRDAEGDRHIGRDEISLETLGAWTSTRTGIDWPAGWRLELAEESLIIELRPTLADQELDTRPTTGVIYWEGSQEVSATREGLPVGGRAYVELAGYGTGAEE